jgi:hypothetical protein
MADRNWSWCPAGSAKPPPLNANPELHQRYLGVEGVGRLDKEMKRLATSTFRWVRSSWPCPLNARLNVPKFFAVDPSTMHNVVGRND